MKKSQDLNGRLMGVLMRNLTETAVDGYLNTFYAKTKGKKKDVLWWICWRDLESLL